MTMQPTIEVQQTIYEFYKLIYGSDFALTKKRSLMTSVMAYEKWSWRVVGITEDAVRIIAANGFRRPSKQLARDHTKPRAETYSKIFNGNVMEFDEWWEWVWEHDKTILMTNNEHHSRIVSKIYDIDWKMGFFQSAGLVGWYQTKEREGAFIKQLIRDFNIRI
jgi:hypothetical protein